MVPSRLPEPRVVRWAVRETLPMGGRLDTVQRRIGWMVLGRHFIELTDSRLWVLRWIKPFLSPLHLGGGAGQGNGARTPLLVHVALVYIRSQLRKGRRLLQPALAQAAKPKGGWTLPGERSRDQRCFGMPCTVCRAAGMRISPFRRHRRRAH